MKVELPLRLRSVGDVELRTREASFDEARGEAGSPTRGAGTPEGSESNGCRSTDPPGISRTAGADPLRSTRSGAMDIDEAVCPAGTANVTAAVLAVTVEDGIGVAAKLGAP
jgi:hypothetical protein